PRPAPSKAALRRAALAARDGLGREQRAAAAQTIAARGLPFEMTAGAGVPRYSPSPPQIEPQPSRQKLSAPRGSPAVPPPGARGQSLIFRAWSVNDRLMLGALGIGEPSPAAAEVLPDIMLVPLAAFDRLGHRIGYGAGHYDFTFAHLRKLKPVVGVGLAFAA